MANGAWSYKPDIPRLSDYPTRVDATENLPELEPSLQSIGEHQRRLWANRQRSLLIIVHGLDASGKDSLIRTLATYLDPAGFRAWSFGRPQGAETGHDFLWRFVPRLPAFGEVVVFNRSYHEGVIAERASPVWSPTRYDWEARYRAIRDFEDHLLNEGTAVLKFWLNLSMAEHRKRLIKRLDEPRKQWKFDPSDIDAWHRREELLGYTEAAIAATHRAHVPWFIIPGDDKPAARRIVAGILADELQALAPNYPAVDQSRVAGYREALVSSD
jgi:polyphosphate kinase 2 (PPK2 family)